MMPTADPAPTLAGRTIVMSGGSRGIGRAIALRAARDGANVVLLAKTDAPNPKLPGTVHDAVDELRAAGGQGLAVVGDVRDDDDVARAVDAAVREFGGIDICVNNASALRMKGTLAMSMKEYDLIQDINTRGTFSLTRACIPHLLHSPDARVLTLSPPLNLTAQRWLSAFPGYLLSKYGMSLLMLSMAAEFPQIAFTSLWPRTTIATAAVENLLGGPEALARTRRPEIVADAAHAILTGARASGRLLVDEDVLRDAGITDLAPYATVPGSTEFESDFFFDD
jgi:citronellol/citronellal dehydrogenase